MNSLHPTNRDPKSLQPSYPKLALLCAALAAATLPGFAGGDVSNNASAPMTIDSNGEPQVRAMLTVNKADTARGARLSSHELPAADNEHAGEQLLAPGTVESLQWVDTQEEPATEPLAVIAGVPVTERDADALRAILQPPPSRDAAKRLAVDAALAWWDIHGWLAGSSAEGRLDAWRAWLLAGQDSDRNATVDAIGELAQRAKLGLAGSPRAAKASDIFDSSHRNATLTDVSWIRKTLDGSFESREVRIKLRDLEPALARALRDSEGTEIGPIVASSGLFWLQRPESEASEASSR